MDKKYSLSSAICQNFLGHSPTWYKLVITIFLIVNPLALIVFGKVATSWLLIIEFIFTLVMALSCYPLLPGGLLTLEAVVIGLTTAESVYIETINNISVILLLIFMVAGIYFMKDLLLISFTKMIIHVRNKITLSLLFITIAALLSAFLDALTVTAVFISTFYGFYAIYHKVASGKSYNHEHDHNDDTILGSENHNDLEQFRSFLRSLVMHGVVGTALGGVCTLVGEPQNLLIAHYTKWNFMDYIYNMAPVTVPLLLLGFGICFLLEKHKLFGYGASIPKNVYSILLNYDSHLKSNRNQKFQAKLIIQAIVGILLVLALGFHMAEIGLIGLSILILLTAFNGVTSELQIGHAFAEALPFASLLVVFFAIISVIHQQHLFDPFINYVLATDAKTQVEAFYIANGLLSMISDNVFVASIYITEIHKALGEGMISLDQFNKLAIAINVGTNIPSIATPNGQAAFLFLLTSALSPLIRLSYWRMFVMALPYTIVLTLSGLILIASIV